MTKLEGAIISAYTGIYTCSDFSVFHEYVEKILERPVWTHELASESVSKEIKEKSESDFMELCSSQD